MLLDPVYPLTSAGKRPGTSHAGLARQFLEGGSRFFQVRAKELSDREALDQLREVALVCGAFEGARFVVNDRCDLAEACGAHGVHLGQTDLPVSFARELLGADAIIGISTHTEEQFLRAIELPVNYVALGPIYPSTTKPAGSPPVGVRLLEKLAARTDLPVVAIGGISLARAPEVWGAGAASVAVVADIVDHPDPAERIRAYLEAARRLKG